MKSMVGKKIIETFYSDSSVYHVVKSEGFFGNTFYIYKNGEVKSGGYNSLKAAVEAAKKESGN